MIKLLFLFAGICSAQNTLTLVGPPTIRRGTSAEISINLTSVSAQISGLQWTVAPPAGVTVSSSIIDPVIGVTINKVLACSVNNLLCLIYGINTNVIPSGPVAKITVNVAQSAGLGSKTIDLTGLLGVNSSGGTISVLTGPVYSVNILPSLEDINGDGSINATDVSLMVDQARGLAACSNDQNSDGVCNLFDVMYIILKVLNP